MLGVLGMHCDLVAAAGQLVRGFWTVLGLSSVIVHAVLHLDHLSAVSVRVFLLRFHFDQGPLLSADHALQSVRLVLLVLYSRSR